MAGGVRMVWRSDWEAEVLNLSVPKLERAGEIVTEGARRRCPVSADGSHGRPPGYTRSRIHTRKGRDALSPYVDTVSPATSPDGYPIGLGLEIGTKPHRIYPKRAAALAFHWERINRDTVVPRGGLPGSPVYTRRDGTFVIGKGYVDHPGTTAQPYLRPALDDLRGRRL
jgi:hypothetical protein